MQWLAANRSGQLKPDDGAAGDWWANMLPSNGPVLGPFGSRHAALAAEVEWLNTHLLTDMQRPGNDQAP